jgi:hypothetical protein
VCRPPTCRSDRWFSGSGKQITEITVLVNQRRQDGGGEWVDAEPTRHGVLAFKTPAENMVESLAKAIGPSSPGSVTTEAWIDTQSGVGRRCRVA